MLTQPTEGKETIIRKNKPQTYLVNISADVPRRKTAVIHPVDEGRRGTTGLSLHKNGERTMSEVI